MAENTEGQTDPEQPDIIEDNRAANAISSMLWVWKWVNRNELNKTSDENSISIVAPVFGPQYVGGFLKTSSDTIANVIKTYRFAYYGQIAAFTDPIRIVGSGLSFADDPKYKNIDKSWPAETAKAEKEKFYKSLEEQLSKERIPDEYSKGNGNPPATYKISIKYFLRPTKKIETESPIKNFEDDDAFYVNTEPTSYYLRFGALLDYIADEIIPKIDTGNSEYYSNPSMFRINRDKYSNFMYSLPNQISLDPRVCIVRNDNFQRVGGVGSPFPELLPFRNPDYTTLADFINPNKAYPMNIYLNFEFIIDSLNSNADEKGDINVYNFLKSICDGLNKALGGINNLEPIMDEETNTLKIIDTTPIPGVKENKKYTLQLYGYNKTNNGYISNFVRKVDLKTAITPEFATMVTVGATAGGYVKGTEGTAFSKWNTGLTDRFKENFLPGNESSYTTAGQVDEAVTNYTDKFLANSKYTTCYGYTGNLLSETNKNLKISPDVIEGNLSVVTEYYKYLIASQKSQQGGTVGFIPFKLSFTMDGLSGIKIYNTLNVDTRFLPKAYGDNLDLIVTGVSHRLANNDWETDIETTVIPKTNQLTDMVISEETVAASIKQGVAAGSNKGAQISSCNQLPPAKGLSSSVKGLIKASTTKDSTIVQAIVDNLEGGYYHPTHAYDSKTKLLKPSFSIYKNSGETLYGIDRYAGNTEGIKEGPENPTGVAFWSAVDAISGFGAYKNTARKTKTGSWDINKNPKKKSGWSWNYMPKPSDPGYNTLQTNLQKYISSQFTSFSQRYFGNHPLGKLVESDGRLKFLFYRATWNGVGFFKNYANNLKSVYNSGERDIDKLICADLTFRYNNKASSFKPGVSKMAYMIDYKKPQ